MYISNSKLNMKKVILVAAILIAASTSAIA